MKVYSTGQIRNVALLGHSGSGKTTLAETMIFESGTTHKRGSIKSKNTVSDFHDIEKEKEKSVYGSILNLDWRGTKINLLDTPGTPDFWGDVSDSLHVADSALFVLNSEHGVETGTEAFWKAAEKRNLPSFIAVNKLDGDKSDFDNTVKMAKERFGRGVVVVQFPYSEGEEFHAIVDVLKMTMYEFPSDGGRPDKLPIPDSLKAKAELLHNELVETVAENDETLLDLYFEHGELDEYQMRDGLQNGMINREIFPLFCCCAERNMGSGRIMGLSPIPHPIQKKVRFRSQMATAIISKRRETLHYLYSVPYLRHTLATWLTLRLCRVKCSRELTWKIRRPATQSVSDHFSYHREINASKPHG